MNRRKEDTLKYVRDYAERLRADQAKRSIVSKLSVWIKNLIVWGIMAAIIGSVLYSHYVEANNPEAESVKMQAKVEMAKSKMTPTGEELARMAEEREAREAEQKRQFEQEINKTYEQV